MQLTYETDRLILSVLDEGHASLTKQFYTENASFFSPYEPPYPDSFFTEDYQAFLLRAYRKQFLKLEAFRYFLLEKHQPDRLIGCVAFSHVHLGNERSCTLSYKLAESSQQKGYALEAINFLLQALFLEHAIHRVQADILPDNVRSLRLVQRLGFQYEGLARSSHFVQNSWKDHARYALIFD